MKLYPLLVPAGSDSQVQFNNGGIFGADSTFTFNDATKLVTAQQINVTTSGQFGTQVGIGIAPDAHYDFYSSVTHSQTDSVIAGANIAITQDTASAFGTFGVGSNSFSTHISGLLASLFGYFGGANANSNGNVTQVIGVSGAATSVGSNTPTITIMAGLESAVYANAATASYAFSNYVHAPTKTTGSIGDSIGIYVDEPTSGTRNLSILSAGNIQINSDKKLILKGALSSIGDTYFTYDSVGTTLDTFVNNTEMSNANTTRTQFLVGLVIPSGTTPAPAEEGALFLDTDASANGTLVMYSNGDWRTVAAL